MWNRKNYVCGIENTVFCFCGIENTVLWYRKYYSLSQKSEHSYYIRMQYHIFVSPKKVRNAARSALILFLVNSQESEVSNMVSVAIVARIDPTH